MFQSEIKCLGPHVFIIIVKPQDCADLRKNGVTGTGVYTIFPSVSVELVTYCDMDTDKGGWTVGMVKRSDSTV